MREKLTHELPHEIFRQMRRQAGADKPEQVFSAFLSGEHLFLPGHILRQRRKLEPRRQRCSANDGSSGRCSMGFRQRNKNGFMPIPIQHHRIRRMLRGGQSRDQSCRSFSAAAGALRDQGLTISVEDRSSGTIVGNLGGGTLTASVRQQADGSVRVQFDAAGARDPGLIDRVSRSYDSRMGR